MNKNCRLIIGMACNFNCKYCCNKIPGMIDRFTKLSIGEFLSKVNQYDNVCLSGGEPFHPANKLLLRSLIDNVKRRGKKVFVYTNLSYEIPQAVANLVDGWSVGFHPTQLFFPKFIAGLWDLQQKQGKNIRVLAEDKFVYDLRIALAANFIDIEVKGWTMNQCDKTDIEDWYIL